MHLTMVIFIGTEDSLARVAEQADATDLKSVGVKPVPVQVRSRAPFTYRGVEQLVACRAHNPKVARFESRLRNHMDLKSLDFRSFSFSRSFDFK